MARTDFLGIFLVVSACGLAKSNEERLHRAEQDMAEGDFRVAIIDSKAVLLDEFDNVRGWLLVARGSLAVSDAASAENQSWRELELVTQLGEIAPQFAQSLLLQRKSSQLLDEVPLLLGAVHLQSGSLKPAEMYLSAAVAAEPDSISVRQFLAETQLQKRKGGEATEILMTFADRSGDHIPS